MLDLSEKLLKEKYIIFISKKKELSGIYLKAFKDGIHPHELPKSELTPIKQLTNIMEQLNSGALLQIYSTGYLINATIGRKMTEGPYCENNYLEVITELNGDNYQELLIDLDIKLTKEKKEHDKINKKLYKGAIKYE